MRVLQRFGAAFMGSILYLTQFNQQVFQATTTESGSDATNDRYLMANINHIGPDGFKTVVTRSSCSLVLQLATVMVFMLSTLTPDTSTPTKRSSWYPRCGTASMPVMNLLQNEFAQHELWRCNQL